ncbi:DsbE family thiol:disulfide interchange protein [Falsirhodobacter xinxiangensis]|uniref:DsbE family thiol:disulfide interchange protein n=1 Tax=Falsirhodobacter xinxiangensis TaxID=2530049 RepID=UPI0010AA8437|nr:DsbE family thiol:disulfide interchange protein [Rhodobacter xinxiangensis]
MKPLLFLPPVLFAGLAAAFYVGMMRTDPDGLPTALAGQAPSIALSALGDAPAPTNADLRGGVKLVNFWASWCAPCRAEHPMLEQLAAEGVEIVGINYKDQPDNALGFLAELGDPFAIKGADATGRTGLDWGLYGVPETFVLDADGRIVTRLAGPITARNLEDMIRPALEQAQVPQNVR